jgi:SAM-dependent methyltransferase
VTGELLEEQVRYYRARAPEYDTTSPDAAAPAIADLRALGPVRRAIELGAGTGQYTGVLASMADEVVAVDAAPEALELLRAKVAAPNVVTVAADVFAYEPDEPADLVVFGALFSHIPTEWFDAFWSAIDRMLAPGGRVFVIDEARHDLWTEEVTAQDEIVVRTLGDGRRFRIVKVLWDLDALTARLEAAGWRARFVREDPFYWGVVERR